MPAPATTVRLPATDSASQKIRSRQDGTRSRILTESAALFVGQGYEHVSVEQILAAADIARSSFYRFFANREEVLTAIIRPVFAAGLTHLEAVTARDARGILDGIFATYLALWAASPAALRLATRTGGVYFDLFRDLHTPFRERITALLRLAEPGGQLLNNSAEYSARLLARAAVPVMEVYHRDVRFAALFQSTMRGLLLRPGPPV
ncbi:MAG: TetR/AcrR family transcriptional regulator [Gammaproteobacteria bacterium]|nr:TetR/AcrR family transcriptional regulator [Gammaproteobacteria bacterium]